MEKDKLKLELLERIINCDDAVVLKKVEEILNDVSEVREGGERYKIAGDTFSSEELNISPELEEELMRRYEDHLQNKGKSYSWEEVKKNLRDSYGL